MPANLWDTLKTNRLVHFAIICLAILFVYFRTWNGYFSTGDDYYITGVVKAHPNMFDAVAGYGNGVRFLNYAMIWTKTRLFDLNFGAYMLAGLLQHAVVSYIVYRFAEIITKHRVTALVAAVMFASKFSFYQIMMEVSASDYSFWGMFHVATLTLFAAYLARGSRYLYIASVVCYAILAWGHDFTLNMPLLLMSYYLLLGRGDKPLRSLRLSDFKMQIPYWIIWAIHVSIQFSYILNGSSEAIYSQADYGPGLHMIRNLHFLTYLIFPNLPFREFIARYFGVDTMNFVLGFVGVLSIFFHAALVYLFWKGSREMKFAISMIYLPFLQYTLWHGDYAGVSRYLYLPSIGFGLVVAMLLRQLYLRRRAQNPNRYPYLIPAIITVIILANFVIVQIWMQRHLQNSVFRRSFVSNFAQEYAGVDPNSFIFIQVPEEKYIDVGLSCFLVIEPSPECVAFMEDGMNREEMETLAGERQIININVSPEGDIEQVYPAASN